MEPLKVVMVCGFAVAPKATVTMRAVPMARALKDLGHQVHILVSPYDNLEYSGREMELDGIPIKNLAIKAMAPIRYPRIPLDFLREVERLKPDIVHVFKPKGFSGLAAMLRHSFQRRPFVLDHDDWEGWGGWNEFSNYPRPVKHFIDFQEHWIPRHSRATTVASKTLVQRLLEDGISEDRIFYVPNGPNPVLRNWKGPENSELEAVKEKFGFGGRRMICAMFNESDRPLEALGVLRDVVRSCPVAGAWIVGPIPSGVREYIQAKDLARDILAIGWLPHEDYLEVVAASAVGFFHYPDTPIHRAKCSGKIVEFMGLGKPVVSTSVGQNKEYVIHGETGFLAADSAGLVTSLCTVIESPQVAQEFGRKGQARIWSEFGWDKTILSVLGAYSHSLNSNGS